MAFPPDFLDEIRARVPLPDIVGRRVKLTRRGREFLGLCPFHNEKTPSFTVSEGKGFYHCFGCGAHGDVIGFLMNTEGLSFPEAVERLAAQAGLEMPRATPHERDRVRRERDLHAVLEAAAQWFTANLKSAAGTQANSYLAERGLEPTTVLAFRLGYAPDSRGALRKALNARGIDDDRMVEAGLLKRPEDGGPLREYFFDRIMFPIADRQGRVIGFGGRTLGDSKAKYLNSPETMLFHKGRVLYNLDKARAVARDLDEVVVTEGYMDVIALAQAGFPAAVAPLGTALTEGQLGEIWRLSHEPILCLDGDAAGRRAAFRAAARALPLLKAGYSLKFAFLPEGEDPDSLLRAQGAPALRVCLDAARPLVEVVWEMETAGKPLDTPERRAGVRTSLRQALSAIADRDLRAEYQAEMDGRWATRAAEVRLARYGHSAAPVFSGKARPGQHEAGSRGWPRAPHNALRTRAQPDRLRVRREQLLLATLINHPGILVEYAEGLVAVVFSHPDLDRLREALIDAIAQSPDLDTEGLKCHLSGQGFADSLAGLLRPEIYLHGKFAHPDAESGWAKSGFNQFWKELRDQHATVEAEIAGRDLAADLNESKLDRLKATQNLNRNDRIEPDDFDRFEAAGSTKPD